MDYENKVVELSANIHTMWKLQCQNLYNSSNLGALAVRECLQNSIDSIITALKRGEISKGRIDIEVSGDDMSISDNGIGMDIETIHTKFLTLGETTKNDSENTGGFGLAKSVILGCGEGFKVETRDNVFTSEDLGRSPIQKQAYRQGTKITVYKVHMSSDEFISRNPTRFNHAIEDYVATSVIPKNISVFLNNERITKRYKYTTSNTKFAGQFNISSSMIPRDTELRINVCKTPYSIHYLYVQLRGLTQFKQYLGWNATADIILNFDTTISPRDVEYPFTTNREGLKSQYSGIVDAICDKMSKAPMSVAEDEKYTETIYGELEDQSPVKEEEISIASAAISKEVVQTVNTLAGIEAQGGCIHCDLVDYIKQYNRNIDSMSKQYNMSKQEVLQALTTDTLIEFNNPLKFSWIVCKSKTGKFGRVSNSKLISNILKWDAVLQIVAKSAQVDRNFYPGIVLDNDVLGLCMEKYLTIKGESRKRNFVMFNPLLMPKEATALEQAIWILNVAAHELAHYFCGQLESHGETWAIERESIFNRNLGNINTIVDILSKKPTKASKADNPVLSFKDKSIEELEDIAIDKGIDIYTLKAKYTSLPIYRMRLTMQIKSA